MSRAIIVFYSYSGNTQKAADALNGLIKSGYEVDILKLDAPKESKSFFGQCVRAFRKLKTEIQNGVSFDVADYDLISFGTPVWAFGMAPALRTYIDKCSGLEGKSAIIFSTYGSGAGKDRCMNEMEQILKAKGAKTLKRFCIQQFDIDKKEKVASIIKRIL